MTEIDATLAQVIRDSADNPGDSGLRRIAHDACLDADKPYWAEAFVWMLKYGKRPRYKVLRAFGLNISRPPWTWDCRRYHKMQVRQYGTAPQHEYPSDNTEDFPNADGWHKTAYYATMALLEDWAALREAGWACDEV